MRCSHYYIHAIIAELNFKLGFHFTENHKNIINRTIFSNCIATRLQMPNPNIAKNKLIIPEIKTAVNDNLALNLKLSCLIMIVLFIAMSEYMIGEIDIT